MSETTLRVSMTAYLPPRTRITITDGSLWTVLRRERGWVVVVPYRKWHRSKLLWTLFK